MAELSNDEILEAIANKSVMDVVELVKAMEDKFGVSAAAPVAVAAVAGSAGEAEAEQTEFNVMLTEVGANKISVIKAVRVITGLGLKEAKAMVDGAPIAVKEAVSKDEADSVKKQLEEAGASAEVK